MCICTYIAKYFINCQVLGSSSYCFYHGCGVLANAEVPWNNLGTLSAFSCHLEATKHLSLHWGQPPGLTALYPASIAEMVINVHNSQTPVERNALCGDNASEKVQITLRTSS